MLNTVIGRVTSLKDGLWVTALPSESVVSLGRPQSEEAGPSILFLPHSRFDEGARTLEFAQGSARVINLGTLEETIVITVDRAEKRAKAPKPIAVRSGDRALIRESESAGEQVAELAAGLLDAVRTLDPDGEFVRFGTRKFINQPDNFVTIIPQPRVRDVRLVVRGSAREFAGSPLGIKKDQNGYSTFKVANAKDLGHAISLLSRVRRKR
jgi:hypothetical protein